jgi:hypothetical protein
MNRKKTILAHGLALALKSRQHLALPQLDTTALPTF